MVSLLITSHWFIRGFVLGRAPFRSTGSTVVSSAERAVTHTHTHTLIVVTSHWFIRGFVLGRAPSRSTGSTVVALVASDACVYSLTSTGSTVASLFALDVCICVATSLLLPPNLHWFSRGRCHCLMSLVQPWLRSYFVMYSIPLVQPWSLLLRVMRVCTH